MQDTLSFLRSKLTRCERVIVTHCQKLPEWQERRILRRMIKELEAADGVSAGGEGGGAVVGDGRRVITIRDGIVANVGARAYRGGYKKDLSNSPMKGTQHGRRILDFYELVEKIVTENGGRIEIDVLEDYLHSIHGMERHYGKQRLLSLISSYINIFNKAHPSDVKLELWPARALGERSVGRYKEVRLVGWAAEARVVEGGVA